MDENMVTIIVAIVSSTALSTIIGAFLQPLIEGRRFKREKEKLEAEREYEEKKAFFEKKEKAYLGAILYSLYAKNIIEAYKKRFQEILEYTVPNSASLIEDDENAPADDNTDPNAMGGDPNAMGGDPNTMGGDPNAMGGDPNTMGGDPNTMGEDPNAMGGETDLTSNFNPQDNSIDTMEMNGDMQADVMQPDDEVVDITELVDTQEETQEDIKSFDKKFVKAIEAIQNIETLIKNNNNKINSKIAEIESEMKRRNPTPMEKLSNRAANSYPFNISPEQYWNDKEKNSNYRVDDDNNGVGQEQYVITGADINGVSDWKNISDSLNDDILYNQTLNNILKV